MFIKVISDINDFAGPCVRELDRLFVKLNSSSSKCVKENIKMHHEEL